jgi:RNA polymerase sigma factor
MDALPGKLTEKIELAKSDKLVLNHIIIEYLPFIKKTLGSVVFKTEAQRDYLTESMLAFIQSVQTYRPEDGAFIPYAQTVIRNRLINAANKEIKLKKSFFAVSTNNGEKEPVWEAETAQRRYDFLEEQKNLQMEIIEINIEFSQWGFDVAILEKNGPKQERSRRVCHGIARKALTHPGLVTEMIQTRKLPIQRLAVLSGVSEKTLEKYRRYIAAVIIIMRGDYPYIHSFLPHFFDGEDIA